MHTYNHRFPSSSLGRSVSAIRNFLFFSFFPLIFLFLFFFFLLFINVFFFFSETPQLPSIDRTEIFYVSRSQKIAKILLRFPYLIFRERTTILLKWTKHRCVRHIREPNRVEKHERVDREAFSGISREKLGRQRALNQILIIRRPRRVFEQIAHGARPCVQMKILSSSRWTRNTGRKSFVAFLSSYGEKQRRNTGENIHIYIG